MATSFGWQRNAHATPLVKTRPRVIAKHIRRRSMVRAAARHDAENYRALTRTLRSLGIDPRTSAVLDIGCGANAPMTVLLHSSGASVTGIDEYIGHRWGLGFEPKRYLCYWREAGPFKTLRKAIGEFAYDRHYYLTLARSAGFSLTEAGIDLRRMSAEALRFEDDSFDVIHSNATWEHLRKVRRANQEVARCLRPRGIAYIEIHLFPSLSGGHDLPWKVPGTIDLEGVQPWQHLRNRGWTAPVYLNRLRERDYRQSFEDIPTLEIVDWKTEFTEGQEVLTPEILEELRDYPPQELTKRSIIAVLRKSA
jgi:SAM-dependent methyltransferase